MGPADDLLRDLRAQGHNHAEDAPVVHAGRGRHGKVSLQRAVHAGCRSVRAILLIWSTLLLILYNVMTLLAVGNYVQGRLRFAAWLCAAAVVMGLFVQIVRAF